MHASRKISFLAQPIASKLTYRLDVTHVTTCQSAVLLQNISCVFEFGPHIHGSFPPFFFLKKKEKKNHYNWLKKTKLLNSERTQWWILKAINDTDVHVRECEKHRRQTCHEYWNCHCFNFHWRKVIDSQLTMAQQSVGHMNGSHSRCHMLPMCRTPRRLFNALPICDLFSFLN